VMNVVCPLSITEDVPAVSFGNKLLAELILCSF